MAKLSSEISAHVIQVSLIVALGGFLMGFDASVISGVVKFIEPEFQLSKIELGWAVASLSLTATLGMMVSGPLSDKYGRRAILRLAAGLFFVSAILSALAPSFIALVIARLIGGFGVGAALIIAPMFIAEIAPANYRGRLVSLNQLNIVIGITVAFFSNFVIVKLASYDSSWIQSMNIQQWQWRWMLGIEAVPAAIYFIALLWVPESPRWLIAKKQVEKAAAVLRKTQGEQNIESSIAMIQQSVQNDKQSNRVPVLQLFKPTMKTVLIIGVSIAILQQITGINAVFFYAPMIFEQTGFGTDASFMQAIFVGAINVLFTIIAILLIDKIGRKALLVFGVSGIAVCMFTLAMQFNQATYVLKDESLNSLPNEVDAVALRTIVNTTYQDDLLFKQALRQTLGDGQATKHESALIAASISVNQHVILSALLGFVACFAVSLGPVMWVLFSELFPNRIRGIAISFVGLINSATSFLVQLLFPWQLAAIGITYTFALYGIFALLGLAIVLLLLPETKGKTLEQLESQLTKR